MSVETIQTERLDLVAVTGSFVDALLGGRRADAEELAGFHLPDGWPDDHDARFLRFRRRQLDDPAWHEWLVRGLVFRDAERPLIGHAGFHGPPGVNSARKERGVELGYTVFEPYRGRGYAQEAVRGLMRWAREAHGIHDFVASVGPWNEPSLAIVRKLGFVQTGEHVDDVDGLELVFELSLA